MKRITDYGLTLDEVLSIAERVPRTSWESVNMSEEFNIDYKGKVRRLEVRLASESRNHYIEIVSGKYVIGFCGDPSLDNVHGERAREAYRIASKYARINFERKEKQEGRMEKRLIERARAFAKQGSSYEDSSLKKHARPRMARRYL